MLHKVSCRKDIKKVIRKRKYLYNTVKYLLKSTHMLRGPEQFKPVLLKGQLCISEINYSNSEMYRYIFWKYLGTALQEAGLPSKKCI